MIVVADTGPIIALAKPGRIDLLGVFGATIWVPPRVRRELLSKPDPDLGPRNQSGERERRNVLQNHFPKVI
jgi:predicted nucleic acid-binding protein